MSWRTFATLLRGLSSFSALATAVSSRKDGIGKQEDVYVVDGGPEHTVAVFSSQFGFPKR